MTSAKTITLTGSTALIASEIDITYYATCSLNMSGQGHIAITASGTPRDGTVIGFICNFSTTNYSEGVDDITFYGFTLPAELAAKTFSVVAYYNAAAWRVIFIPSWQNSAIIDAGLLGTDSVITAKIQDLAVTTAKINDLAVTTGKIAAEAVTNAKLASMADATLKGNDSGGSAVPQDLSVTEVRTLLDQTIELTGDVTGTGTEDPATGETSFATTLGNGTVSVAKLTTTVATELLSSVCSFEANEVGYVGVKVPYACTVKEWGVAVIKTIAGTDDGTCTLYDNAGNLMTGSTITVTLGTAVSAAAPASSGFFNSAAITANNSLTAGQMITIRTQKTTAGGRLMAFIKVQRA